MPVLRRQLPAYSPLSLAAVRAAVGGAFQDPTALRTRLAGALGRTYAANDALLVGSGTTALQLALAGARATTANGAVALPAYCCYDIASAADGADAPVVLYDIDPRTLGPDDSSVRRALSREPTALVAAHLYGYPVDMHRLARLCRDAGAVLIEDAAQGSGGRLDGTPLGSFGSVTVLSFGRGKGTTAGAGGAMLSHDDAGARILAWARSNLVESSKGFRELSSLVAQWALGRPSWYWLPAAIPFLRLGETIYHRPRTPRAMSHAGLGALAIALRAQHEETERRRALAEHLLRRARASDKVRVIETIDGAAPGFLRLPLRSSGSARSDLVQQLSPFGAARAYPAPLITLHPFSRRVLNDTDDFEGARTLAETLLTFPTHSRVTREDVTRLDAWLTDPAE